MGDINGYDYLSNDPDRDKMRFLKSLHLFKSMLKKEKINPSSIYCIIYLFEHNEWFYSILESTKRKGKTEQTNGVGEDEFPEMPKVFFEKVYERNQILNIFKVAVVGSMIPEAKEFVKESALRRFSAEELLSFFKISIFGVRAKTILNKLDEKYARYF